MLALLSVPVLLGLLALGIPIYLSLSLTGIAGLIMLTDLQTCLNVLQHLPYPTVASYLLLVVPLFVMMGNLAFSAGVSRNAYDISRKWLSRFPGGLAMATTMGCAAFAAACGSSPATAAAVGKVAIPEMLESGYDKKLATGCVATGGCLGILIPPSIVLVMYGVVTETSVGALLIGGFIPGIITVIVFTLGIFLLCKLNPRLAPATRSYPWKERFLSLKGGWGVLLLFLIVIGGIYFGVATPTEAAALGAGASFVMMLLSRENRWQKLKSGLGDTARTCCMIFLIVVAAMIYSHFLKIAGVANALTEGIATLNVPPFVVLLLALAIFLPLGMFLEPMSILLVTLPILHPIIVGQLGYNTIWFAILVTKLIEVGLITPPVGLNVYIIAGLAPEVPLEDVFKGVGWFLLFELTTLSILIMFPFLSTWLPNMMY
jgi:tripartite ATP-independent transporter DctM subunit